MTRSLIILIGLVLTCFTNFCKAELASAYTFNQKISDSIVEKTHTITIPPFPVKDTLEILMGCGIVGESSNEFAVTKALVIVKKYESIKKDLSSTNELIRIISVIALEELNKRRLTTISAEDEALIVKIKRLKTKFYMCNGCTGHYYGRISDIFENKCPIDAISFIKYKIGFTDV